MFDIRRAFAALRAPSPTTAYERGVVALDAGNHALAVAEFERALGDAPHDAARAAVHNKLGVAHVALGARDAALEAFCRALELEQSFAPALVNVGNLYLEDGHALDAVDYYRAALASDQTYPAAHRNLGIALRRLGRRDEAVRALRSADRYAGTRRRSDA